MKNSIIPIFVPHLGCPNDCVFCNQRRIAAPKAPSADEVTEIIESSLQYCQKPQIAFYGGSFTAIEEHLQEEYLRAGYEFVKNGSADSLRVSTRPDCIDDEALARLKKYGVKTVEIGAQSMDNGVLKASNRGHTAEDTGAAARRLKENGFELILQMMVGLPSSSREQELRTARELAAMAPIGVRIYPVCVIENSRLCDMWRAGAYHALSIDEAADLCAEALEIFQNANIPVVRIGLNPTEELSGGGALAGAYHPAMGQIVYSRLLRSKACRVLDSSPVATAAEITVPKGKLSDLIGQNRQNARYFSEKYSKTHFEYSENEGQTEDIKITLSNT